MQNKQLFLLILTAHCTMQLKEISIAHLNRLNPNHIHVAVGYTFKCTFVYIFCTYKQGHLFYNMTYFNDRKYVIRINNDL